MGSSAAIAQRSEARGACCVLPGCCVLLPGWADRVPTSGIVLGYQRCVLVFVCSSKRRNEQRGKGRARDGSRAELHPPHCPPSQCVHSARPGLFCRPVPGAESGDATETTFAPPDKAWECSNETCLGLGRSADDQQRVAPRAGPPPALGVQEETSDGFGIRRSVCLCDEAGCRCWLRHKHGASCQRHRRNKWKFYVALLSLALCGVPVAAHLLLGCA